MNPLTQNAAPLSVAAHAPSDAQKKRAFWLKHLHQWHWMSAAACLVGMILFSITGLTLNHAGLIRSTPEVTTTHARLPAQLAADLRRDAASNVDSKAPLPEDVAQWIGDHLSVRIAGAEAEWSDDEIYVSLPRPGGDAWLTVALESGDITHELTDRGWLAYLNDLHKGRHAGAAWSLFIDLFAIAALIFAATGLLLLKMHATHRPGTWPMVALGLTLPLLLAILFIH
jgi:hypothetical protein